MKSVEIALRDVEGKEVILRENAIFSSKAIFQGADCGEEIDTSPDLMRTTLTTRKGERRFMVEYCEVVTKKEELDELRNHP